MAQRPLNVLVITSDQQRWDALGVYNDRIRTPNLDTLARRGVVCDHAYTPNPVCTPARVSLLTGEYPSRHGCYTIGTSLPEDYPTVPARLAEAGYFTALCGKAHFQRCTNEPDDAPGTFESPPHIYDQDFFDRWSGPYYGFQHARLAIAHGSMRSAASMHYGAWLRARGVDIDRHFGRHEYAHFGPWDLPPEHHYSTWTANETIAAIDLARDADKPFFLWSSFQDPHNPCVVPEPWASMYDPDNMPDYRLREGELDDKPPFYRGCQQWGRPGWQGLGDPELDGEKNWYCFRGLPEMDDRRTRELTAIYYGMVSFMDEQIGRIFAALDERGLWDRTVVVFTADHGDYLGNHGLWWKGLPAYQDAQRVPFLAWHPQCRTPGGRSKGFHSLVDIGPTALACAGVPLPAGMQGVDQTRAWCDAEHVERDWAMVEYRPTEGPFMQKTLVHDRWKLVVYHGRDYGELYDLQADPDQYRNLWDDPDHREVRWGLLRKLIFAEMDKDGSLRPRDAWA